MPVRKGKQAIDNLLARADAEAAQEDEDVPQNTKTIHDVDGPVTVVDNSVNVLGDNNTASGNSAAAPSEAATELMAQINAAVDEIYKSMDIELSVEDLGRIGYQRHYSIMSACENEEEYPHAIEIMKIRLRNKLRED